MCSDEGCLIKLFLQNLKKVVFDEELSYEKSRSFFTRLCAKNLGVFKVMHELQVKRKENIEKLTHLIESKDSSSEEKKKEEKLAKLVVTKIEIQKQIDILVESIYLKK